MSGKNNALRVFVDSNILISAVLSESSIASKLLTLLIEQHHLIICSYSITEISEVIERKFPKIIRKWDKFLTTLEFEIAYTPSDLSTVTVPYIRDPKDLPILVSAIVAQPDIVVTGDLDFHTPEIQELFTIMMPIDFLRAFSGEFNH
ncbi:MULTISPECIES: putative toxin-antitoxin system toxin component, PIN family [Dehalobacter]|jgi:putative PIN family toxin of toxin-antitoxin system|uniref:Toxin n=2 Tax=Dehalobacter restrictus TaxID=55583 RepID=A0ABM5P670_DEHRP|nr:MULTISPECIES: putative toxin-antitoxin system toxin component, PIN family [Dehalobacter]AHF10061.1 toxin [Dehalobacter restrictus DSM 9455]MCG1025273.1 putative toxin-antitoxin system toxin component, PIN family [Dehalobacter sp.]MDJ0306198.1 putative toxin-antitoxin system toxin component, PIN family [Dehalobacter sp.]OCZ51965.1 putative toxin-antitoxin system toxin component, PIN family [Dehalobacter sp. TeCB1]QHA00663.1 putative toxin-antitoxin system toxin component, PIN family [Dehalob